MRLPAVRTAVLAVALAACAGAVDDADENEPTVTGDPLAATLEADVERSSARLLLHLTNSGPEPIPFTFPSSQRHDFVVTTRSGEEVWRWSEGRMFAQAIIHDTLAPGETWEMEAVWDHEGREGSYVATGVLTAGDRELRKAASFTIP